MTASIYLTLSLISFYSSYNDLPANLSYSPSEILTEASVENTTADSTSLFQYLEKSGNIEVLVSENLKTILNDEKEQVITEGELTIIAGDKNIALKSKIECGGKTRRSICKNPPLKFNFKKKELAKLDYVKSCDKFKIVFQCSNGGLMEDAIKSEKLIYDLYSLVSDYGYKALLTTVKVGDNKKHAEGLILEDDKDLTRRSKTMVLKNRTIGTNAMHRETYVRLCLFQYMIGNCDWSARKGHNTKLFKRDSDNALLIVPYDFDYSGIINNSYAIPPEQFPITEVTDRYFMDKKITMEELSAGVSYFLGIETQFYDMVNNAGFLSSGTQKKMLKFLEGSFKIFKNEGKVKKFLKK